MAKHIPEPRLGKWLVTVVHVCNTSTQEVEAGGDQPQLHREVKVSVGYMRACLKQR